MNTESRWLEDHFSLNIVAKHLENFRPPKGGFDPKDNWKLCYRVYTLAGRKPGSGHPAGSLWLKRKKHGSDSFILKVDYQKQLPGQWKQSVVAEIHCLSDTLSTPLKWTFDSEIIGHVEAFQNTKLKKSGVFKNGKMVVEDGKYRREIMVPSPYTVNWALFDAVQRMSRAPGTESAAVKKLLKFTMFDHFDQVKEKQSLQYRKTAQVVVGTKPIELHAYEHLGEGIVPWIYWVDSKGRLLFVISGQEAYLLES